MSTAKQPKKLVLETEQRTIDVVCGMEMGVEDALCNTVYHDVTYYFCTHNCQQYFNDDPRHYVWEKPKRQP